MWGVFLNVNDINLCLTISLQSKTGNTKLAYSATIFFSYFAILTIGGRKGENDNASMIYQAFLEFAYPVSSLVSTRLRSGYGQ